MGRTLTSMKANNLSNKEQMYAMKPNMNNSSPMSEQTITLQICDIIPHNIRKHIFYGNILYDARMNDPLWSHWEPFYAGKQNI